MAKSANLESILKSLIAAKSDDETRYFMTECYLDKSDGSAVLVATDARTLVYYKPDAGTATLLGLDALESGYVDIDTKRLVVTECRNALVKDAQFPQWRKVVPATEAETLSGHKFREPDKEFDVSYSAVLWAAQTGISFNPRYLKSAALFESHKVYVHATEPKARAFRIEARYGGTYNVLIMPTTQTE